MNRRRIDLNADVGESFGAFSMGQDEHILPWITSANIACGYHGGDPQTILRTVKMAVQHRVHVGAHPSLPDLLGFGRRMMQISPEEIYSIIIDQLGSLHAFAHVCGTTLHHVKPHGALYNMSAQDEEVADAIAKAVYDFQSDLILVGLAQSKSIQAAKKYGLRVAEEVFADRTYQADGTLTPRTSPHAMIHDVKQAVNQVLQIVMEKKVQTINEAIIPMHGDTVCIHGDHPQATLLVKQLHRTLRAKGIELKGME